MNKQTIFLIIVICAALLFVAFKYQSLHSKKEHPGYYPHDYEPFGEYGEYGASGYETFGEYHYY